MVLNLIKLFKSALRAITQRSSLHTISGILSCVGLAMSTCDESRLPFRWRPVGTDLLLYGAEGWEEVCARGWTFRWEKRCEDVELIHLLELGSNGLGYFLFIDCDGLLNCEVEILPDQWLHYGVIVVADVGSGGSSGLRLRLSRSGRVL